MANIAGFGGYIILAGATNTTGPSGNINEWSATLDVDTIAIPAAFGSPYEDATLGQGRISGSFSGVLSNAATGGKPFSTAASNASWSTTLVGDIRLNATGGTASNSTNQIYIAAAMISNVRIDRPHNSGPATISADFRNGTTDPVITWS